MADYDRKISVLYILRMLLLLAVFIVTVTSEGVRLPDIRLRPLPVPSHCQNLNHCKEHEGDRDQLIGLCFNNYCTNNNETVHCMEQDAEGKTKVIYYCSVPRICDAGLTDKVVYNASSNQVLLTNIECREPYFQPHSDFCNKTCQYKHVPTPPHVIILFPGNSSQSAIGVCNSSEGYVFVSGPNTPSVFSIDEYRDPCICRWDFNSINCSREEDVCPNGTCVARCPAHLTRDLCDCSCKLENETLACQHDIPDAWFNGELNISTTTNSESNYITASSTSVTTDTPITTTPGRDPLYIGIFLAVLVVLVFILVLMTLPYCKKRGSSNDSRLQRIVFHQNSTNVEQADTVLIGASRQHFEVQAGDALLEDNVSDHQEEESNL